MASLDSKKRKRASRKWDTFIYVEGEPDTDIIGVQEKTKGWGVKQRCLVPLLPLDDDEQESAQPTPGPSGSRNTPDVDLDTVNMDYDDLKAGGYDIDADNPYISMTGGQNKVVITNST